MSWKEELPVSSGASIVYGGERRNYYHVLNKQHIIRADSLSYQVVHLYKLLMQNHKYI
jgi:hypothetical protein